jgi:hypothetical protein
MMKLLTLLLALGAIGAFELSNRDAYKVQPSSPFGRATGRVETIPVTASDRAGLRVVGGLFVVGCLVLLGAIRRHGEQGAVMRRELGLLLEQLNDMEVPPYGYPIQLTLLTVRRMVEKGETAPAIEMLTDDLLQWNVPLTSVQLEQFARLADYYGADAQKCELLRQNPFVPEPPPPTGSGTIQMFAE